MKRFISLALIACLCTQHVYANPEQATPAQNTIKDRIKVLMNKAWIKGTACALGTAGFAVITLKLKKNYDHTRDTIINKIIYDGHRATYELIENGMVSSPYVDIKTIPEGHFLEYVQDKTILGFKLSSTILAFTAALTLPFFSYRFFKESICSQKKDMLDKESHEKN